MRSAMDILRSRSAQISQMNARIQAARGAGGAGGGGAGAAGGGG